MRPLSRMGQSSDSQTECYPDDARRRRSWLTPVWSDTRSIASERSLRVLLLLLILHGYQGEALASLLHTRCRGAVQPERRSSAQPAGHDAAIVNFSARKATP